MFGVALWLADLRRKEVTDEHNIGMKAALLIGLAQVLALVPGTSRSGATIIGGLLIGLKRKTATEFSFLLAVPTMLAATAYDILKNYQSFQLDDVQALGVGFVTAFVVALVIVRWFLNFVKRHTFIPFGIYRIIVGFIFLFVVL
ncbi:MAG: undecaprenyl-diphosphate phosphatase [Hydrogenimonas sp.]|nr:undecaprenyl-diphosphate phosphatase [Hydrogenimonas sp.]